MTETETVSTNTKRGLSIFALILVILGDLLLIFHCLSLINVFVSAVGSWVPTPTYNPVLYWVIFGVAAALLIAGSSIYEYGLKKKKQGIKALLKAIPVLTIIGIVLIFLSIFLPLINGLI